MASKERPIIFNGEMVRAILDGRKTQTRRIMKPQPTPDDFVCPYDGPRGGHIWPSRNHQYGLHVERMLQNGDGGWDGLASHACHLGEIGDRLWVRETWQGPLFDLEDMEVYAEDSSKFKNPSYCVYAADGGPRPEYVDHEDNLRGGWRTSIHMPRWASRITLEITGVRVERLNSISAADARAEGITDLHGVGQECYLFTRLWRDIYGEDSWSENPWVWVIEFKRVEGNNDGE